MTQNLQLTDIDLWHRELGLLPVPLFGNQEQSFVLLNGTQGNFCLDLSDQQLGRETRNFAWSSNVGHYVALVGQQYVEVQRWDKNRAAIERYSINSVRDNLEQFHTYLEKDSPRRELSIVSHTIQVFRKLRAVLGDQVDGETSLKAFLYLLASATEQSERSQLILHTWGLSQEAAQVGNSIRSADWDALQDDLNRGRPLENLVPQFDLLLRHSSGQLFQEAHYEALFVPQPQLRLDGFLPSPIKIGQTRRVTGVHFTPPALARTLVEETLATIPSQTQSIVIFDPASGSGEFLRESLRQLKLKNYSGQIKLIGWDISEAACEMARFVLAWEKRDAQADVSIEIQCQDSLNPDLVWPQNVDLVLMNPPFLSWQDMTTIQRDYVKNAIPTGSRPDLSYAFMWRAAFCLREKGVLGSILPASLLDSESAEKLRKQLSEHLSPSLIARLGSHLLFSSAMIDAALYIAEKDQSQTAKAPIVFWADHKASSTSAGLRTLRKIRYLKSPNAYPVIKPGFSIYVNPLLGSESWSPRPYKAWNLIQSLDHLPKVKDLFFVRQGIRTGQVKVFVIDSKEWKKLPESERVYFRPAVVNRSIQTGALQKIVYVFFPYGQYEIEDENDLQKKLTQYYNNYLLPAKHALEKRKGIKPGKWWQLVRHRAWQIERNPKLVSTYFGDAGSFAWDETGEFLVVQGYAWSPKNSTALSKKVGLAYLAILNSPIFSELLAATSNHTGGGQWNLSKKFVDNIPLPDLFSSQVDPSLLSELAEIGANIHAGLPVDNQRLEENLNLFYGLGDTL